MKNTLWSEVKRVESKYIDTPLTKYVGEPNEIVWPWILVVILIGAFLGVMLL